MLRWTAERLKSGEGISPIGLGSDRNPKRLASERALEDHYSLYIGYVEAFNRVAAGHDPEVAGCSRTPSFLVGAVALHEAFFLGVTDRDGVHGEAQTLTRAIADQFGDVERWWADLAARAMCARGWAILAMWPDGFLNNITLADHDVGSDPEWEPICVIDCYEHAYWRDHGPARAEYLAALADVLDWNEMERRFRGVWRRF